MFIANDSNYTFGQFLAVENGDDIKAPVYTKCFTDTEALKGYRFIHDPEETNPEKCVSFSIYDIGSETATATPFLDKAAVSDLTSVMFRLDAYILDDSPIRDKPFYHVIVPVENIADGTLKYLVIKMTKEVELFPDDYPYYELADTFADAQPTSAEAPSGGGGEGVDLYELLYELNYPQTTLTGEYDAEAGGYIAESTVGSVPAAVVQEISEGISYDDDYNYTIYNKADGKGGKYSYEVVPVDNGEAEIGVNPSNEIALYAFRDEAFTVTIPAGTFTIYRATEELADLYQQLLTAK